MDAVVMGTSPTGLYAVRELAGAGLSVCAVDLDHGCALQSRYLRGDGRRFVGSPEAIEGWLSRLAAGQDAKPVLVPTSDVFIEFVIERAERLAPDFAFAPAYHGLAARLLDKVAFHALCAEHGMATPGIWKAPDQAALRGLRDQVPYPCILKPILIHRAKAYLRGKKVLVCRSADEFSAHLSAMPDDLGGWFVQEIIPGPESEITLFAGYIGKEGAPLQTFTARKLRQYPPGFGSASLVTSEACAETQQLTLDFLRRIGFRGVCGAEYKRDPRDGRLKIIEINPRPTLWFQVSHDAGMRVVETAVRDLSGREPEHDDVRQDESVRWRYVFKDAVSARFYRKNGSRFTFPAPDIASARKMHTRSWAVFSRNDLLPTFAELAVYARKAWKRRQ